MHVCIDWQMPPVHWKPGGHGKHCWPNSPQLPLSLPGRQLLPEQQPPQLLGPHMMFVSQMPMMHAALGPQSKHWPPPCPQAFGLVPDWQTLPRQQPGQFAGPQLGTMHACALGSHTSPWFEQFWQATPPVPQVVFSRPSMQKSPPGVPAQQPFGQLWGLQSRMR